MCSIDVKVSELKKMIDNLVKDRVDYVTLSILEEDEFAGEVIPKTLHFEAFDGSGGGVDYESIEEVVVDPFYKIDLCLVCDSLIEHGFDNDDTFLCKSFFLLMAGIDCSICGNRIKAKSDLIFHVSHVDGVISERVLCRACSQKEQKEFWEN